MVPYARAIVGLLFVLLAAGPTWAQSRPNGSDCVQLFFGDGVSVGAGFARSWVTVGQDGQPRGVGVTFTEAALSGLPGMHTEYVLPLPPQARLTPFDHIGVDWNPRGHVPPGIYDVPHFDFHFYMIPPGAREGITATGADMVRVSRVPPRGQLPAGYVQAPGGEPRMGAHWVDGASREFHGGTFTRTFVYGTYDGRVIFYEPMVTRAFLNTWPNEVLPVKQPAAYAASGYYPTRYSIRYDPQSRQYTVALEGLTYRQAAGVSVTARR